MAYYIAEGQPREHSWLPNEEVYATADMESDQLHAPALSNFCRDSNRLSVEPASRCFRFGFCSVVAI